MNNSLAFVFEAIIIAKQTKSDDSLFGFIDSPLLPVDYPNDLSMSSKLVAVSKGTLSICEGKEQESFG